MPLETFSQLMAQLGQFPRPPTIHLSGYGEPMFHDDFLEIVKQAKATGARVEMTTNGLLLNADKAIALIDLGLDRLVVSIDGMTPEGYEDIRTDSSFEQVIENLVQLRLFKLKKKGRRYGNPQTDIAFVAMKRNVADLPKLTRLAARVGVSEILVSNLVPHTMEMEDEILYAQSLTTCTFRASQWVADMSLPKLDLDSDTLKPLHDVFTSTASIRLLDVGLNGRNDYCRFSQEGYAAVRWDGQVSPCLSLLHDHPVYLRKRRKDVSHYALGNVNKSSLRDIWQSPEFANFRARLREFLFSPCTTCGGCERFEANFEDCYNNSFPTCGGCLWAQGFVQCP
jgi:MoaA/NifB/PqqE/SkfB family radical SAM enzyme